jgi:hypothetical protein
MPNWTINAITLKGQKGQLGIFKQKVAGENGAVDFNCLIPMPKHSTTFCAKGNIGREEEEHYGKNNWYDWSREHWGTKWNACESEVAEYDDTLAYRFATAWDCPRGVVEPVVDLAHELGLSVVWDCDHEASGYESIVDDDLIPHVA